MSGSRSCSGGFSMIELVVVVLITTILLAVAVPRLFDDGDAKLTTAAKMLCADIATVQNMAVANGATMEMSITANSYSVRNVNTGNQVTCGGRFPVSALSSDLGVSISAAGNITFNSLGEPKANSADSLTLHLVSDPDRTKEIIIERETGHVRLQ